MNKPYVHGYGPMEAVRLQDQAASLVELLHSDTRYAEGETVLEAGCGVGAQTVTLARNSPKALITSIDISEASLAQARSDPTLGVWLAREQAHGAAVVAKLREIVPPAGLTSVNTRRSASGPGCTSSAAQDMKDAEENQNAQVGSQAAQ